MLDRFGATANRVTVLRVCLALGICLSLGQAQPARAASPARLRATPGATYAVTSTDDDGDANPGDGLCEDWWNATCTLRAAVEEVIAQGNGEYTITVPAGVYTLTDWLNFSPADVTIHVVGTDPRDNVIIDGDGQYHVNVYPQTSNSVLALSNLTLRNMAGSALWVECCDVNLTLDSVLLRHNSSVDDGGGLLMWSGTLTMTAVQFEANSAANRGGGLFANFIDMRANSVTFLDNSATDGGGLYSEGAWGTLNNATFAQNTARNNGGGFAVHYNGFDLYHPTLWDNQADSDETGGGAGGGFHLDSGGLQIANAIVAGNRAGSASDQCESASSNLNLGDVLSSDVLACAPGASYTIADPALSLDFAPNALAVLIPWPLETNVIDVSEFSSLTTDARGQTRPYDVPGVGSYDNDLGAYERNVDASAVLTGAVYADLNFNHVLDPGDQPIPNVYLT